MQISSERLPTTIRAVCATAFAISAALFGAGCAATGSGAVAADGQEVFLQPVGDPGPDPFTASTATNTRIPPPLTQVPRTAPSGTPLPGRRPVLVSGAAPGLYAGTRGRPGCDVEKQIRLLRADPAAARAFAATAGVSPSALPGYLRGLTPVVLRADTNVTNHGFKDGRAAGFQAVLQAGTGVLVDDRGVPRVRCACGNPLTKPAGTGFNPNAPRQGAAWPGFRPSAIVIVVPAPQVVTNITIINIVTNTLIERPVGNDGSKDRPAPSPSPSASPRPSPSTSPSTSPSPSTSASPSTAPPSPGTSPPAPQTPSASPSTAAPSASTGTSSPSQTPSPGTTPESSPGLTRPGPPQPEQATLAAHADRH
ncbi:DUF6777 domain-containing protein [Streptomyces sp. NPDC002004]